MAAHSRALERKCDHAGAQPLAARAEQLAEQSGDLGALVDAQNTRLCSLTSSAPSELVARLLDTARRADLPRMLCHVLNNAATWMAERRGAQQALPLIEEALALSRSIGEERELVGQLSITAEIETADGHLLAAQRALEEAEALAARQQLPPESRWVGALRRARAARSKLRHGGSSNDRHDGGG